MLKCGQFTLLLHLIKKRLESRLNFTMVTRMGFGPMNTALRGQRVEPLHQRAMSFSQVLF